MRKSAGEDGGRTLQGDEIELMYRALHVTGQRELMMQLGDRVVWAADAYFDAHPEIAETTSISATDSQDPEEAREQDLRRRMSMHHLYGDKLGSDELPLAKEEVDVVMRAIGAFLGTASARPDDHKINRAMTRQLQGKRPRRFL